MNEMDPSPAAESISIRTVTLDHDVVVGVDVVYPAGSVFQVRKPGAGELRGLTLMALSQLDVDTMVKLLPRITMPTLIAPHAAALDPADLMQFGGEVMDFLLPKAAKPASLEQ